MRIFFVLLCCHLVAAAGAAREPESEKASRPRVFLITIDTLRADHVHCYGYDGIRTPVLDLLAEQGIRFTQAFTPSPITNSSHTSIMTGLLPSSHGVSDFGVPLAAKYPTLAELLTKNGYRGAAFIGAVILDSKHLAPGLDRGFEFYDNFPEHTTTKSRWGRIERRGMEVEQHAESWLNAHADGTQFVWLHFYDPHDPYEPPPPFSETYKDRLYDGEIAYADSALGQFLTYLKKQGWYEGAMIVVVGDHGEGLGEHHEDTHGIFLYDSTTHVPLIVKLPNEREAGKTVEGQVRTTDIMPTILSLVGIATPAHLDGDSLEPLLDGGETGGRPVFGETEYPLRFGWAPLRSIRKEGFKFIEAPKPELYDLHGDPGESRNQYEPWNGTVQKMRKTLAELSARSPATGKASPATVSAGTVDELHALGYLGAADAGSATDVPEPSLLPDPKDKIEQQNLLHTATMAFEEGETEKARAALEKVLQLDAGSALALRQLGRLEMAAKNYGKAAEYLRRAHAANPNDAGDAIAYARALELSGDLAGARDVLLASLKVNPEQFEARLALGRVYAGLKDFKAAEDQFEAAVLLQPGSSEGQIELAKTLIQRRKFSDAAGLLEAAREASNRNPEIFELLAEAYAGLGRQEGARLAREKARTLRGAKQPE
ncbi:MAG TPA: sulfatase-like hydrolase/transferase [Candidatus Acidoferrum sp.]|nr:sulfatase-like hydrolase/transferase [Candidatus Acidoferrum sp.]